MIRWSRHARNRMRLYGLSEAGLRWLIEDPESKKGRDEKGNPTLTGTAGCRRLTVVLAEDDPSYVITVWEN